MARRSCKYAGMSALVVRYQIAPGEFAEIVLVGLKRPFEAPQPYEPLVTPGPTTMPRLARVGVRHICSDWSMRSHQKRTAGSHADLYRETALPTLTRQYMHMMRLKAPRATVPVHSRG